MVQEYPNTALQLLLTVTENPTAAFTSSGATVAVNGTIEVQAVLANSSVESAFTLTVNVLCAADAALSGNNLTATLDFVNASFALAVRVSQLSRAYVEFCLCRAPTWGQSTHQCSTC